MRLIRNFLKRNKSRFYALNLRPSDRYIEFEIRLDFSFEQGEIINTVSFITVAHLINRFMSHG